jgi:peptidoglycan-associated lipoprotein
MRNDLRIKFGLLLVTVGFLFFVSCATTPVDSTPPDVSEKIDVDEESEKAKAEEMAKQRAEELAAMEEDALKREKAQAMEMFVNENVHFDYNESILRSDARDILKRKVTWLQVNPDVSVVIEGHCDERGSTEYNLALGDRRASSVKSFLVDLGVSGSRLTTISYGEEMPLDAERNESAWSKNRRVHLTID